MWTQPGKERVGRTERAALKHMLPYVKQRARGKLWGFPAGSVVKNPPTNAGDMGLIPGLEDPWRRKWQLTPVFSPGKLHGQRSLVGYNPWGRKRESDATKQQQKWKVAV